MRRQEQRSEFVSRLGKILCIFVLGLLVLPTTADAASIDRVRNVDPEDLITIKATDGWLFLEGEGRVVFPPGAETVFLVDQIGSDSDAVILADPESEATFFSSYELATDDVINTAYASDATSSVLLSLDSRSMQLSLVTDHGTCCSSAGEVIAYDASSLGIGDAQGASLDPSDGRFFVLDVQSSKIVVVEPDSEGSYDLDSAYEQGRISAVDYSSELRGVRGLAYNWVSGHFFLSSATANVLYEPSAAGTLVAVHDYQGLDVSNLKGIVFAPSLDYTDDPSIIHLFVATERRVTELSIDAGDRK